MAVMVLFVLIVNQWLPLNVVHAPEPVFRTAWFVASMLIEPAVVLLLRTLPPAWQCRPSTLRWTTMVLVAAMAAALPFIRPVATLFGPVELSPRLFGSLVPAFVG